MLEAFGVVREEGVGRLEMEGEAVVGYLRVEAERAALEAELPIVVVEEKVRRRACEGGG